MQEAQQLSTPKRIANGIDQDLLPALVDCIPALIGTMTASGEVELVNRRVEEYFGRTLEELKNGATGDAIHPDDRLHMVATWKRSLETGESYDSDHRLRRFDGVYRWFHTAGIPLRDAHGGIIRWYVLLTDIEERKRSESLLGAEKRTLEMIAGGASLIEILNALCDTIDAQAPGIISTATLMDPDGKCLWPVAHRNLPKDWIAAITPAPIGPYGSCGTAAF
jgi:PAS domain S-box-containing protein